MIFKETCEDDIHINSLRQLDHKISAALNSEGALLTVKPSNITSSIITSSNQASRPFGSDNMRSSFHNNLNQLASNGENYLMETTRAFPYERLTQTHSGDGSVQINNNKNAFKGNPACKIYQDLDEFKGHLV